MTPRGIFTSGALLLLFGIAAQASAQVSKPDHDDKPKKEAPKNRPGGLQSRDRDSDRGERVDQGHQREMWQAHRARRWNDEHRTWGQRGGYKGFHIPETRFHRAFGRDHRFRLYDRPMMIVGGHPGFQYEGYWFSLVDPWPEQWSDNWYETDDAYVDYEGDGYYLYNVRHPGVRLALNVHEH